MENYLLDVVRFKEQIQEAIDVMREWQQKAAEKTETQWIEGYCQGLQYASELASFLFRKQ